MTIYDDKTKGAIDSGGRFILPSFQSCAEVTFKASYVVASNVQCEGKVTALFDLIVLGDIEAAELDIKGKFVCLGKCEVSGTIFVQNEIWVNKIRAERIEAHDKILAQEIEGGTIFADGSIVVGKILEVEKLAKSEKYILCGETAYGSGKVAANVIITGEPLDLDDGEEAVISPNTYSPDAKQQQPTSLITAATEPVDPFTYGEVKYAPLGDFGGYLDFLTSVSCDDESKTKFARWQYVISEAEAIRQNGISDYTNIAMVIWLAEIAGSVYFKNWDLIKELFATFKKHFNDLTKGAYDCIDCVIDCYDQWLEALSILSRFGALMDSIVYQAAFELVVSNLGLKAKFVSERFYEKGWKAHGE